MSVHLQAASKPCYILLNTESKEIQVSTHVGIGKVARLMKLVVDAQWLVIRQLWHASL